MLRKFAKLNQIVDGLYKIHHIIYRICLLKKRVNFSNVAVAKTDNHYYLPTQLRGTKYKIVLLYQIHEYQMR